MVSMLPSTGAGLIVIGVAGAAIEVGCVVAACCCSGASAVQARSMVPAATAAMAAEMSDSVLIGRDVEIGFRKSVVRVFGLWGFSCARFQGEDGWSGLGPTRLEIV